MNMRKYQLVANIMNKFGLILAAALVLSGCSGLRTYPAGQNFDMLEEIAKSTPTCVDARECEIKWNAARNWVLNNAGWRLQVVTGDYMETYNPVGNSRLLAARVTKEPIMDATGYKIMVKVWCNSPFGCEPDTISARLSFNRYIAASWRDQPPSKQQ